ncbi:protein trichome birefringence-like isoform X1 [Olea europaea var. sylvestris]|uniref:Trichome birefringence-like n=1 Tax=Olea europaea subsp. europaea TaxID=158383 RepID=A0A8S0RFJ7_OLEEU|nr:protein trichome birefringence-like isoform X1 [Olea europaea var. sylvestris]CAA2977810.1 trichome birefringence-like [Olea europaea subsp. europaea]
MADITKYAPIGVGGGNFISDFKSHFSLFRPKRTVSIAYGFVFLFIVVTIFLAFSPSPNSSSPWFTNIFAASSSDGTGSATPSSIFSDESYRSHFSSFFSYFYAHNSSPTEDNVRSPTIKPPNLNKESPVEVLKPSNSSVLPQKPSVNRTADSGMPPKSFSESNKGSSDVKNQTQIEDLHDKVEVLKQNQIPTIDSDGKIGVLKQNQTQNDKVEVLKTNQSITRDTNSPVPVNSSPNSASGAQTVTKNGAKGNTEQGLIKNLTSSLMKKHDDLIKSLTNCDFFDGNWVKDDSYPLYKPGSCSLIDEQFNCFLNGRPDNGYHRMKWKPRGCTLPRLNGSHMLEMLRGKRVVFVGDSLNRNMWESLICILRNSVKDQSKVYEQQGRHHFRTEASYSFIFEDYKCTVEFFVTPFLVQEWEAADRNGTKKETLRLDIIERSANHYKSADIIVFNTGHWWTHEKTSKGEDYYQEGSHVYKELNVLEAFRKALTTWGRWIDANVNPRKTLVFFRGYSASHFSGGQWNSGGQCDNETEPIKNDTYLTPYPPKMTVLENVFKGMNSHVTYLNVTRMTDYRKDGHPSIYRKQTYSKEERRSPLSFQDCSHWCLPGVPDAWNEILYAELLVNQKQQRKGH